MAEVNEELSLRELIIKIKEVARYISSKWYFLLIAVITGGAIGVFYAKSKVPVYYASTTFVLEANDRGGLSQYAGMAAMVGLDVGGNGGGIFQGDNILELYKSRRMIELALLSKTVPGSDELLVERFIAQKNMDNPESINTMDSLSTYFKTPLDLLGQEEVRKRDSLMSSYVKEINNTVLKVDKADKKSSLIKVDVVFPDEVFAKSFNESIVAHVNRFYTDTKIGKSLKNVQILEKKVDSVKRTLTGAIYSSAEVLDRTPNLNPTRQAQRIAPSQQAQYSAETNKIVLGQLIQNLELTKMSMLQEQPLIQLVDSPVYPLDVVKKSATLWAVFGGILAIFLTLAALIAVRMYHNVMQDK